MGYYIDLHFRDKTKTHSPNEIVEMFYANDCERVDYKKDPEWVEFLYENKEDNSSSLIHIMNTVEDPATECFADVRMSWGNNRNHFCSTIKNLILLGDKMGFYVYDAVLKTEINNKNLEQVVDQITGVATKMVKVLGKVTTNENPPP